MYECTYIGSARTDTLDVDSLSHDNEILLDDEGNPIEREPGNATEQKHSTTIEEEVTFENL